MTQSINPLSLLSSLPDLLQQRIVYYTNCHPPLAEVSHTFRKLVSTVALKKLSMDKCSSFQEKMQYLRFSIIASESSNFFPTFLSNVETRICSMSDGEKFLEELKTKEKSFFERIKEERWGPAGEEFQVATYLKIAREMLDWKKQKSFLNFCLWLQIPQLSSIVQNTSNMNLSEQVQLATIWIANEENRNLLLSIERFSLPAMPGFNNELTFLPPEIRKLTNLNHISIMNTWITSLPPEIGQLTALRIINVASNQLTSIPKEIGLLNNLQTLHIGGNKISSLPQEFGRLIALKELGLIEDSFTSLPPQVVQLTNLETLFVSRNKLTSLPSNIDNLIALRFLDLSQNQLTSLPKEIGRLTALQTLHLEHNQLTFLPSKIGRLTALQALHLEHNQLTFLPSKIGRLASLQELRLRYNLLTFLPYQIDLLYNLNQTSITSLSSLPRH